MFRCLEDLYPITERLYYQHNFRMNQAWFSSDSAQGVRLPFLPKTVPVSAGGYALRMFLSPVDLFLRMAGESMNHRLYLFE